MDKDHYVGMAIILAIIAIVIFGGAKNSNNISVQTPDQKKAEIEQQIKEAQAQIEEIKKQEQLEKDKQNQSQYYGLVKLQYVNRSDKAEYEYVSIHADQNAKTPIPISGWQIKSLSSGATVSIPLGTKLFFAETVNSEETIYLSPGDNAYINTGISPNGSSFEVNKCSGYLSQFQTFIPYLPMNCPRPADEDLSSIPKLIINDKCFDYIDSFPSCTIQTESLPQNWSYECTKFIYDKINYPSCVNTHKNDSDFYSKEWRIYLKRSATLWKSSKESIVLYDNLGKVVDSLQY